MRIYLSSTLNDLEPERAAVTKALTDPHVVVHSYDASETNLRDKCVDDVASCDIYVGIIGLRYGFCPPPEHSKSITEIEFDAAGEAGLRRLIFVKHEDAILASKADAHTKERDPKLIEDFRTRLTSGAAEMPTATIFSDPGELTTKLLRALKWPQSDDGRVLLVPAPAGDTELQRMLSKQLNRCWAQWPAASTISGARICQESETLAAGREGMPCDLFRAAAGDALLKVLTRLSEFVAGGAQEGPLATSFRSDVTLKEIVLQLALVAAERYVLQKKVKDGRCIAEDEVLASDDERLACILAAASFGFGVKLVPGQRLPHNFARAPAAEFGHEEPRASIALELLAQARRMKGIPWTSGEVSAADLDEDILIAELEDLHELFGCGLILTDLHRGPLADPKLRASIRDELGVPSVLFGPPGTTASDHATWLLNNLKGLIGPLIDAALGPLPNAAAAAPTKEDTSPSPSRTDP